MAKRKTKKRSDKKKCTCASQVQNTRVTVSGGGGGASAAAPVVYATYAPPPINMPTSFPWESGAGFQPDKQDPPNFHGHGVTGTYKQPSIPQSHSDMSTIDKWMWDADQAKPQSEPGAGPPSAMGSVVHHQSERAPSSMASSGGILSMRSRAKTPPRYGGSISSSSAPSEHKKPPFKGISVKPKVEVKLPRPKSEASSRQRSEGYSAGHSADTSGVQSPNSIPQRASAETSYGGRAPFRNAQRVRSHVPMKMGGYRTLLDPVLSGDRSHRLASKLQAARDIAMRGETRRPLSETSSMYGGMPGLKMGTPLIV